MRFGNVQVEQILSDGTMELGYDTSLSTSEITTILCRYFPNLKVAGSSPIFYVGDYKGHKYAIRCKNVTYLGNPHPYYKKRIQIADDLYTFFNKAVEIEATPLLLGIYTHKDNTIFVDYKIDTYIHKKAHNSSAHVYASDLCAATEEGFFQKLDFFNNQVTAFKPEVISVFLDEYFEERVVSTENMTPTFNLLGDIHEQQVYDESQNKLFAMVESKEVDSSHRVKAYTQKFKEEVVPEIKRFFEQVDKKWNGIDCYKEMIASNYRNKFQSEWAGFFLEFAFEKYIAENQLESVVHYYQDKSENGIDLDLFFPRIKCYGDLKAHSEDSRGIQGNDWNTVFSILNQDNKEGHIYYIICEHETKKDSDYNYEVTKFWNTSKPKMKDLLSYHKRMKNNVTLKKVYMLDINYNNKEYLTIFKQGINSNGKPRAPKIMIEHDNLEKFVVEEIIL